MRIVPLVHPGITEGEWRYRQDRSARDRRWLRVAYRSYMAHLDKKPFRPPPPVPE